MKNSLDPAQDFHQLTDILMANATILKPGMRSDKVTEPEIPVLGNSTVGTLDGGVCMIVRGGCIRSSLTESTEKRSR